MTTVVLADDHHVVRQGLRSLLDAEGDISVVGEAGDGLEAVQLVERLQPDVLVLDLMMASINGLEVARQVTKRVPGTAIVILSMYSNESYVLEALRAGAKAYVVKESTSEELARAIRRAAAGHRYLSASLSERAIEVYAQKAEASALDTYDLLTTREREVLHLAARGSTNKQIAERLCISQRTVEVHRASMMRKLGLHRQADLLRYAVDKGIVPPEK